MKSAEIRQSFLDFFKERGHTIVPSESLMPSSPNLLFTNAGMNQFVPYFLEERPAPYPSAADTQKCIRAGGKHNDLEDVGFDTYHHTFFEMLGNWSFGDYFKKEAIEWSWELLTKVWKFPKERLYATVYEPGKNDPAQFDEEAYNVWEGIFKAEGMDPSVHIRRCGPKDNFWMMGETGPCGPCSEIHMDLTPYADTNGKLVNADNGWCIEIWNLVFIQFNAQEDGSFKPLPNKHVDTGMGLERVAGIMETTKGFTDFSNIPSNYNSDLFSEIFQTITALSGHQYQGTLPENREHMSQDQMNDCVFRVLGDHIRTLAFSIADGIMPSNEGRGYVLRRILRRAVMFGQRIDLKPGFFAKLLDPLIRTMGGTFKELEKNREIIRKVLQAEEESFNRTLARGLQLFEKIAHQQNQTISGEEAFVLYDTYGFPIDLTQILARERNLKVDLEGFETSMEMQRVRARAAQKKTTITVAEEGVETMTSEFVGFEKNTLDHFECEVTRVVHDHGTTFLTFDQTPFYAEMGGQVGDTGYVECEGEVVRIVDTIKDDADHFLHRLEKVVSDSWLTKRVSLKVDRERRLSIERNHTATHILHWALRKVLGSHVQQAGSLVDPDYLRFDFTHFEALSLEQVQEVERLVNERIIENASVKWTEMPFEEKPEEVIAFFGEKYGAVVRVVDVGGFSKELCGGTHVDATGEIGLFKIVVESAIAAGTRRLEAVTGSRGYQLAQEQFSQLQQLAQGLSCKPTELTKRFQQILKEHKALEKQVRKYEQKELSQLGEKLSGTATEVDGVHWISELIPSAQPNDLRGLAVQVEQKLEHSVIILASKVENKVSMVALCSLKAQEQGHKAGDIIRKLTTELGGKGGGKPDFAMGGAPYSEKVKTVLKEIIPSAVKK